MDKGKLHAALAHLDATGVKSPHEIYLRAEILRKTGRAKRAVPLYSQLLGGCAEGHAYHGLGLISGRRGKLDQALDYLTKARVRLPTDIQVRNDLGYALFLARRYESARHEFLTALELDGNNEFSVSNLVLLLLVTDEHQKAQSLAVRMKLSGEAFNELVAQARDIRNSNESEKPAVESIPREPRGNDPAKEAESLSESKDPATAPAEPTGIAATGATRARLDRSQ
jgi:Flp pilus assembly protein TadD